jgi:mRNA interferase MazF
VLDQIRTVDKARLVKRLGKAGAQTRAGVLSVLGEMFAP